MPGDLAPRYLGAAAWMGMRRLPALSTSHWPALYHALAAAVPEGLDSKWPAVSALAGVVNSGIFGIALLAVAAGFLCYAAMPRTGIRAALFVVLAILAATGAATAGSFAISLRWA